MLIALIGVLGTASAPVVTNWLQNKRAERDQRLAWERELRTAVEGASAAFREARVTLDQALTGQKAAFESVPLYLMLEKSSDQIALHVGSFEDELVVTYRDALENWIKALNLATTNAQQHQQEIADARNAAENARRRFVELAGARLSPELTGQDARQELSP